MTVPENSNIRTEAVGNGITVVFPFDFLCLEARDLQVSVSGTVLPPSQYSVSGLGQLQGGSVTFASPPAAGAPILMELAVVAARAIDYQDYGDLFAGTVNFDFDRLWLAIKSAFGWIRRALVLGPYDVDGHGSYRANNNRIQDLADPAADQDAVNRRSMFAFVTDYVDKAIAGVVGGFGWFLQAGIGAIFRTFQDKMRDFVNVKDFGAVLDGVTDDTIPLQRALATGKKVRVLGIANVTDTLTWAVDGQVLSGDGKDGQSVIINNTNDKPLFASSVGSGAVYRRRCGIEGISFVGNPLTTRGVDFRGLSDGLTGDADKSCFMRDVRIFGVGAGPAFRVNSWSNNFYNVELWENYQGLHVDTGGNALGFDGLYVSNCTAEALLITGTPGSITFKNCVFQYSGGTNYMLDIQGGYSINFIGTYLEQSTAPLGVVGVSNLAKSVNFKGTFHNLVAGTANVPIITSSIKQVSVDDIFHAGGAMASFLQLTGTLPLGRLSGYFVGAGSVTTPLDDQSTRKAGILIEGSGSRFGPTAYRGLIGESLIELRRSDTDAVVGFWDGTGKMFFGPDTTVPALSRSGGTLSMTYGAGTGTFRAPQLGLGATGGPIWLSGATSPEGANTASPGSLYSRTSGGANTTLYVKEIGTGNTGWVAK